ncbi:E3 ubiquitin/ISG15 ligase TRIM25-like [Mixophyes fleayi]|uniref:E3 ubiquitin/ISG15 ligase TRIM25-like n=1 Tax=Mixophyes fleayi TaxID=3061075 RepID=UPI003F4E1739
MASADLRDELNCSICLNIYTDPVTLRCGHNFCRVCINHVMDTQEGSGVYTCPECRAEFQERPALQRNITLCNIAQRFLSAQPEQEVTGIFCTYCITSTVPAVKSCLMCEASLCENHLRVHSRSAEHVLSQPTTSLGNRKCSVHNKIMEYFCTEDSNCICVSCRLDGDHRGHQVELLDEASKKKKEQLRNALHTLTTKREETEQKVQSLQERKRVVPEKAAGLTERVTALFKDIRRQLDDLEKRVLSDISRQEEQVSLSISDLIQQLEIKKDKLSRKMSHIEEMCNMSDPVTVLQVHISDTDDICDHWTEDKDRDGDDKKVRDDLDLDLILKNLHMGLSNIVTYEKRGIYLKEASSILLDVNTASNNLTLSDDLKLVSMSKTSQSLPTIPERFENYQVLSTRSFSSEQHYWEVETSRTGSWIVGMAYTSIERKGDQSFIGYNNKSWGLRYCENQYSVRHNKKAIDIPYCNSCHKFRVSLDYENGQLSFYELSDPIRHVHTFTATFTEPLHAVFRVWGDCWVRILS